MSPTLPLCAATPSTWLDAACEQWRELLIDHAYCEKKAASTAVALLFAYPEDDAGNGALSRLAREELRHFEQVASMMRRLGVAFRRLAPGRYAGALRAALATSEPQRKVDLMLVGALIEARSCERFTLLAPRLHAPLGEFYATLAHAEARHFELYIGLARTAAHAAAVDCERRLNELAALEAQLIVTADAQFRFHSGVPSAAAS